MSENGRLSDVIRNWQNKLLQLSRRNNVLYFKPGRQAVGILETTPDEMKAALSSSRRGLSFDIVERRTDRKASDMFPPAREDGEEEQPRVVVTPGDLTTDVEPKDLQRRLLGLQRKDREWREEQGVKVLHLALGFLEWFDQEGQAVSSPLILLPCDLARRGPGQPFRLLDGDEDPEGNTTLAFVLSQQGIAIPEFDHEEPSRYLSAVRRAVAGKPDWQVTDRLFLATFAYSKIAMWKDLEQLRRRGTSHPLIRGLAGEGDHVSSNGGTGRALPRDRDLIGGRLDDHLPVEEQFAVLPADASQLKAIHLARSGNHLVVHGPPGTGKSQTIANLIATLLAEGKRVLFVAEKTAALDVVKRRLSQHGLGVFALDLHSERGRKSSVYQQLREAVEDPRAFRTAAPPLKQLQIARNRLNRAARELHVPRSGLSLSARQVQGRYAKVLDSQAVDLLIENVFEWDQEKFQQLQYALGKIARRPVEFREHETSPFLPLKHGTPAFELTERVRGDGEQTLAALDRAQAAFSPLADDLGVDPPASTALATDLAVLVRHLSLVPVVPENWLTGDAVPRLRALAKNRAEIQTTRRSLESELAGFFPEDVPDLDYRELLGVAKLGDAAQQALLSLMGPAWEEAVLPSPPSATARMATVEEANRKFIGTTEELKVELGFGDVESRTFADWQELLEQCRAVSDFDLVTTAWFDSPGALRSAVESARERCERLDEVETGYKKVFFDDAVDRLNPDLLDRFRIEYRSFFRRWSSAYRRDRRLVIGLLREPQRLKVEDAISLLTSVQDVRRARAEWKASAKKLAPHLFSRFQGRKTDWSTVLADIDKVEAMLRSWTGSPEVLKSALTSKEAHSEWKRRVGTFEGALSDCVEALRRLPTGVQPEELRPARVVELVDQAEDGLSRLVSLHGALSPHVPTPPRSMAELVGLLTDAARLVDLRQEEAEKAESLENEFGERYEGPETDWSEIRTALDWTAELERMAGDPLSEGTKRHATTPRTSESYERMAEQIDEEVHVLNESLSALTARFSPSAARWGSFHGAGYEELAAWAREISARAAEALPWLEYRQATEELDRLTAPGTVSRLRECTEESEEVAGLVWRRFYSLWLDAAYESEPGLKVPPKDLTALQQEFERLDRAFPRACIDRVRERCFAEYPDDSNTGIRVGEVATLQHELSKKKRQMSVRRLLAEAPNVVQALKPCFLMSPLAVSQYLPRAEDEDEDEQVIFDVVIFDEASQVFPEDAVPAIARSRQAIVVGDEHQLPPTSFFRRTVDDEEDYDDDAPEDPDALKGQESILDAMVGMQAKGVADASLDTHYRSKDESLIAFSNRHIYRNRLLVFPNAERGRNGFGVRDVFVPEGRYDAGGSRTNRKEAENVVEVVLDLMDAVPEGESIGVVTLSRAQADLTERLLERALEVRPDFAWRTEEDRPDRFFVKNLENVQGDERDHIILSIGFGPTTGSGAVPNRFGPVNAEGGERRLNVAVTRARRTLTLVHSLRAEHIVSQQAGPQMLRRYIEYAQDPQRAFEGETSIPLVEAPESEFEEAVLDALRARGHKLATQVGVSGYRIDLAILSEDGLSFDLGIECDGATYHSSPAARDRDWLRQLVLEGLGWRIHRVWSTAWIRDPQTEIARIEEAIFRARAEKSEGTMSSSGVVAETYEAPQPENGKPKPETSTPLFRAYSEASLADLPVRTSIYEAGRKALSELVRRVAEVEGPVHRDIVVRKLREHYGIGRAGKEVQRAIDTAIRSAVDQGTVRWLESPRDPERCFLTGPRGEGGIVPRGLREPGDPGRRIEHICAREIEEGLLIVVAAAFGATREEAIVQTAREFGFQRVGVKISEAMDLCVDGLIEVGRLLQQNGKLVVASRTS